MFFRINYLGNIVFFLLLIILTMSCSELTELNEKLERDKRERGWECTYDGYGNVRNCGFIN